jgi:hypothetical protein
MGDEDDDDDKSIGAPIESTGAVVSSDEATALFKAVLELEVVVENQQQTRNSPWPTRPFFFFLLLFVLVARSWLTSC